MFEHDGRVAYFYRYDRSAEGEERITGSVHVFFDPAIVRERDVSVRWNAAETAVGLFLRGELRAVFTEDREYAGDAGAAIPAAIVASFGPR